MVDKPVIQKKVCLLGPFAVGKTSLVRRFVEGRFDDKYLSTIGVKISRKPVNADGVAVNLILWDLAGSEEYNGLQANYLQGAAGGIIVCDLTRPETLRGWEYYTRRLRHMNPDTRLVLVANKVDLGGERVLSDEQLRAAAAALSSGAAEPLPFLLTSAKSGENVPEVFRLLAERLL
jgi:small GTP-binding protein